MLTREIRVLLPAALALAGVLVAVHPARCTQVSN